MATCKFDVKCCGADREELKKCFAKCLHDQIAAEHAKQHERIACGIAAQLDALDCCAGHMFHIACCGEIKPGHSCVQTSITTCPPDCCA
jgi:hypothetical protein